MSLTRARIPLAVAAALLLAGACRAAVEPIVTSDLLRLRSVGSIDVARDGSRAVFTVISISTTLAPDAQGQPQPRYANNEHLFLLNLSQPKSEPAQLTFGERRDRQPRLSWDGKQIAFVREAKAADGQMHPQVWMMPVDGGEARQITSLPRGADQPLWSPAGDLLLISSAAASHEIEGTPPWPHERPQRQWRDAPSPQTAPATQPSFPFLPRVPLGPDGSREQIRAWLDHNAAKSNPVVLNRLAFQDEQALRGEMEFAHLFTIDLHDPNLKATRISGGFFDHRDAAFMPDGRSIVYAARKTQDMHPDRALGTDLWRVSVDGSDDRLLLSLPGFSLSRPQPILDGSVVAYIGSPLDEPTYGQERLGLAPASSGGPLQPDWLTDDKSLPTGVHDFRWQHAKAALVFTTAQRGGFPMMTVSSGLLEPATLVSEEKGLPVGVHAFGVGGGTIVYSHTSVQQPCALMVRDAAGKTRLAYDLNPWIERKALSLPVESWITRPDGVKIQAWLMEPTNRKPGEKYPLVLEIHGGPMAMWGPGEFTMWLEFQLLCSWGYGVVYANPRGSGGYGYEFQKDNFQDWGEGPAGDVLAAVDEALRKEWIDPDRLVVTGGSYGGYLTAWIISHDHRFKAAVAQRGVYDLATFFGEGNAWQLVEWNMGGFPFDARYHDIIHRNSPFTYVSRIHTPLLIMHGSEDLRTGVSQSEMLYRALKALNRPVEYVRYPAAGHDLSRTGDPLQRMDRLSRIIEFFERYSGNTRPAPAPSAN